VKEGEILSNLKSFSSIRIEDFLRQPAEPHQERKSGRKNQEFRKSGRKNQGIRAEESE